MLNKLGKEKIVVQIKEEVSQALDGVLADYRGTDVVAMSGLRRQGRQNQVYVKVVRNTLLRRAIQDSDFACFEDRLTGPTILALSRQDLGSAARLFRDFAKEHPSFEVKGLAMQGKFIEPTQIDVLASLPTHSEAITQLAGILQSLVQRLPVLMLQISTRLVRVLDAVRGQKG